MPYHLKHGPRRLWLRPWRRICQCGMGAWPCHAVRMRREQKAMEPTPRQSWAGPTMPLPRVMGGPGAGRTERDLMTRGQRARSAEAFRR